MGWNNTGNIGLTSPLSTFNHWNKENGSPKGFLWENTGRAIKDPSDLVPEIYFVNRRHYTKEIGT